MIEIIKAIIGCEYCNEQFEVNTELCLNPKCSEYKGLQSNGLNCHYDVIEDEEYDDYMDHIEVCKIINKPKPLS